MNFYKEYNRLEIAYSSNPQTSECYRNMTCMFSDLLEQLLKQVSNRKIQEKIKE